jgi:hypothetical protein
LRDEIDKDLPGHVDKGLRSAGQCLVTLDVEQDGEVHGTAIVAAGTTFKGCPTQQQKKGPLQKQWPHSFELYFVSRL